MSCQVNGKLVVCPRRFSRSSSFLCCEAGGERVEGSGADESWQGERELKHESAAVVVVGPDLGAKGGISAVNRVYRSAGLFANRSTPLSGQGAAAGEPHVAADYTVQYFESSRDGSPPIKLFFGISRLIQFALTPLMRPAVVHLHSSVGASFLRKSVYLWLARLKGARIVLHIHPSSFWDDMELARGLTPRVRGWALSNSDLVIVLTGGAMRKALAAAPGAKVVVLPNPVDVHGLQMDPKPARRTDLIVFLGWYVRSKGVFDLIEALERLRGAYPALRAVFGGFKGADQVRRVVRSRGLDDRIEVCDWLDRNEVTMLLRTCAIFALPTYTEGIPMVLLEAMACGAPIVTCPVGGIPEILMEHRNAIFCQPGDIQGLVKALHSLLADPAARASQSGFNEADAQQFDVRHLLPQLEEHYRQVLSADESEVRGARGPALD